MARIVGAILDIPPSVEGCIVEAGCFKGGSTTKLSLAAQLTNRKLIVFDSFAGLPVSDEKHGRTIFGQHTCFVEGLYAGRLEEVREKCHHFGHLDSGEFRSGMVRGYDAAFPSEDSLAFIDVDLASSTRTCLQYL